MRYLTYVPIAEGSMITVGWTGDVGKAGDSLLGTDGGKLYVPGIKHIQHHLRSLALSWN